MQRHLIDEKNQIIDKIDDDLNFHLKNLIYEKYNNTDLQYLLNVGGENQKILFELSNLRKESFFGNRIMIRGVIEISNICRNKCNYCAMSKTNNSLNRYSMTQNEILEAINFGIENNIRTFHISSGDNDIYTEYQTIELIKYIKNKNCQVVLVMGQKNINHLKNLFKEGLDGYISKFETSSQWLYNEYNDKNKNLEERLFYIKTLQNIGFKVGTGNIVGLPFQSDDVLVNDLLMLKKLSTDFASTSTFIPNKYSKYKNFKHGDMQKSLNFIALMRLMLREDVIIPTNSSIGDDERKKALDIGANLISINLTPENYLNNYIIYDNEKRKKANFSEIKKLSEKYDVVYTFDELTKDQL